MNSQNKGNRETSLARILIVEVKTTIIYNLISTYIKRI